MVNFQAAVVPGGFAISLGPNSEASFGSFYVNLGTYYSLRSLLPWASQLLLFHSDRPPEYACDERLHLRTSLAQGPAYPDTIWEVSTATPESPRRAIQDALFSLQTQGLPWFEQNADLERAMEKVRPPCWLWARDESREPDQFFRAEDLFAALALRLDRVHEAIQLFEVLAARSFSAAARNAFEKQDARLRRRLARSTRSVQFEPTPFWHDGALARLAALSGLRPSAPERSSSRTDAG